MGQGSLAKQGIWSDSIKVKEMLLMLPQVMTQSKPREQIPINKVGEYQAKDEGNTTLPLEMASIVSTAILDSGAGISIATKSIWEKWGKPALRSTCMNLQLADDSLENPIGLLENVTVKSCGIEYDHTFTIVDFGNSANYEVILG